MSAADEQFIEWGIRRAEDEYPFSVGAWTREDAIKAAVYNDARWGGNHRVVSRTVTAWKESND